VQRRLEEEELDAVVLRLAENVLLVSGYYLQVGGPALAFVPREGEMTLLLPDYEEPEARHLGIAVDTFPAIRLDGPPTASEIERHLRRLAAQAGATGGRIGFEGAFEAVAPPTLAGEPNAVASPTLELIKRTFESREVVDFTAALEDIRSIKTEHDIERLTVVNEIAMIGLDVFKRHARPGITEVALAAEVEAAVLRDGTGHRGARVVRAWATVLSGPATAQGWQYFRSGKRLIEKDDVVMIEMGTVADGYWCDHTRTVVAGKAGQDQRRAFAAAMGALEASFAAATPGATGDAVDRTAREACRAAGFEQFLHHTGHGTGFRYHESRPAILPGSDVELSAGMVIACEPGVYEEGIGGFRWEDDALVTDAGAKPLATSEYELD